ncbi:hypothetical protein HELRODRAFT_158996 [Helobdella robusta]|uniref:Uncharacterized protein n=1 Tax=Helobdella robusta TaxID=6412 RepID=T1ENG8_HELRO|nr:hypothetical protein HELRODRAFT_158996 [Helobdella robusta]ESO12462.1 hypothetical protein HELRODRAFT_158996 [Helobdella robusta]
MVVSIQLREINKTNAEKLQKSEPMEIASCVRNYTNEYRIQQRTLGPQIAQQKQKNEADSFSQNPRPVFTGPVCQSVGFRTNLACFHWAVESGRLSHNQGPVFTGPSSLIKKLYIKAKLDFVSGVFKHKNFQVQKLVWFIIKANVVHGRQELPGASLGGCGGCGPHRVTPSQEDIISCHVEVEFIQQKG